MSKNQKAATPESLVLRTGVVGMIFRWVGILFAAGAVLGIFAMLILNLGLLDGLALAEPTDVVAVYASNNAEAQSDLDNTQSGTEIDLDALGIEFYFEPVVYNGEAHKLVATYADGREVTNDDLAKLGLSVTYYNNVHTDAGRYEVNAVFADANDADDVEYKPLNLTAVMIINKADIKGATFDSLLVEYDGEEHVITVKGKPEGTRVDYSMNRGTEAGVYHATAVIHGLNYNPLTLEATLTIVDLKALVGFDQDSYTFTYDGKAHSVELNTENVLDIIKEKHNFNVKYSGNGVVNAGSYTVVATVSADGFTPFNVSVPVKVEKGDLVAVHGTTVEGSESVYDGNTRKVKVNNLPDGVTYTVEYYLNGEKVTEVKTPGTYTAKVTFVDTKGNLNDKTLECEIVINKIDISELVTFKGASFTYGVYGEDETPYERKIEAICDLEKLAGMGINVDNLVITYVYGDRESSDSPLEFTEAGEYVVKVIVTGDETYTKLYADVVLEATLTIKHAFLAGVSVDTKQTVIANGKYQIPEYHVPDGTDVKCYLGDKEIEGVKNAGIYRVKMVFTKGNYQTTRTVTFTVMLNPLIVLIGAIIGILAGLGLGIYLALRGKKRDEESDATFARPTEKLTEARGNILCQSHARYGKPAIFGRLYLTDKTVEFYNNDLRSKEGNMLIKLRDVRNVDVVTPDVIEIRANDQDYVFEVPACQANAWKDAIVKAKAAPIVRKPDPAPVVIVEKQTEFIPMLQPQPAADTLTTVDFQVKVKTEPGAEPQVIGEVTGTETTVTGAAPAADSAKE